MSDIELVKVSTPIYNVAGKMLVTVDLNGHLVVVDGDTGLPIRLDNTEWTKNQLINPGFNFAQRQVPGTLTTYSQTASRAYAFDRWFVSNENASLQAQQIDTAGAFETGLLHRYYCRLKKITSGGKFLTGQILSAEGTAPLRGRTVRLTTWMKRTVASAMTVRLGLHQLQAAGTIDTVPGWAAGVPSGTYISAWGAVGTDPTLGTALARINPKALTGQNGVINGAGLNCDLTAQWVQYSACFDLPTDMKNLIAQVWTDGQPAANDELNVAQMILTDGPELVEWSPSSETDELVRCLRHYNKSFPLTTAPAQNAGLAGAAVAYAVAGAVAAIYGIRYPVTMRAAPTVTFFNPAAANAFTRNILKATDATVTTAANGSDAGTMVNVTGLAAWVAGDGIGVHYTADAEL